MLLFAAGLAGILYLGLTAQPSSTVVLLPEADGRVGAVDLRTGSASQSLESAYASATSTSRGVFVLRTTDAQSVQQRYGQTLAAMPAAPESFVLQFEFGSAMDIAPAFAPVLEQLRAALARHPAAEITVIGHTDRVGSMQDNDALSLKRAHAVRSALIGAGMDAVGIEVSGRGEREPAVATADEVEEERNRRVEITVR